VTKLHLLVSQSVSFNVFEGKRQTPESSTLLQASQNTFSSREISVIQFVLSSCLIVMSGCVSPPPISPLCQKKTSGKKKTKENE